MEQLLELQLLPGHARDVGGGRHRDHLDDDLFRRLLPVSVHPGRRCFDIPLLQGTEVPQEQHTHEPDAHLHPGGPNVDPEQRDTGLYLFLQVVKTFTTNNVKLRLFLVIGWGMPVLFIAAWAIAKSLDRTIMTPAKQEIVLGKHCPWMVSHPYDWFYQAPAILVLCVNVVFLVMIMWVLITKLWSATNAETQQYRKASKALLVLIPLLGVTYVLVLMGPTEGQVANAFYYTRAVLLSSQGLFVALFYCFLITEVQNAVRHHIVRWTTARDLDTERRYYNNWSPRSRTESIRLYCPPSHTYRKRDSSVSETTTTTVIVVNSTTTFLDKSKKAISEDLNE
nr:diuretic hormone receptor-like isoform X2 [Nomia melanderi]